MALLLTRFCRFGNYIGDAAESDEEVQHGQAQPQPFSFEEAFEGDEEDGEDEEAPGEQQLMEVDGL